MWDSILLAQVLSIYDSISTSKSDQNLYLQDRIGVVVSPVRKINLYSHCREELYDQITTD